jgi:imidazolonepropionase-like amidohydrolase
MLAIRGGKVYTMTGRIYDPGTVLVEGNIILDVYTGSKIPHGANVLDVEGKYVLPGLIDAHTHLGIVEEIYREEGDDCNEITDPVSPHLRAIDAIYPEDLGFADALAGGVTAVVTGPGSANVLGGEMVAMKTSGRLVEEMILKNPAGLKAALGENPKRSYGSQKKAPYTRMASAALVREALVKAGDYLRKIEENKKGKGDRPDRDLRLESLGRVLRREMPLRVHAHRADDIMTAIRIAREFDVQLVVEHCTEGYKVAGELSAGGIMAVLGPIITNRAKVELQGISLENARVLAEAGVVFAIMTDHPVVPAQYLPLSAGLAVRGGLSEERALQAITIDAARIMGMEGRLGSLEPGKEADIAIFDGHPFDTRSKTCAVFVSGRKAF